MIIGLVSAGNLYTLLKNCQGNFLKATKIELKSSLQAL